MSEMLCSWVMPDSILYIAPIDFRLNIIIGFPIIEQLKEVHLYKDGRMTIPVNPSKSNPQNLALDVLDPIILLRTGNDTLFFAFDLGATQSVLTNAYYEKYKQVIRLKGIKESSEFGGAGGMQKKDVYTLPSVDFFFDEKK